MHMYSLHSSRCLLRRFYGRDDASKTLLQLRCRRIVARHSARRHGEKLHRFPRTCVRLIKHEEHNDR